MCSARLLLNLLRTTGCSPTPSTSECWPFPRQPRTQSQRRARQLQKLNCTQPELRLVEKRSLYLYQQRSSTASLIKGHLLKSTHRTTYLARMMRRSGTASRWHMLLQLVVSAAIRIPKRTLARGLKSVKRRVCAVGSRLAPAGSPLLVFTEKARLAMDEALYNGILAALEAVHGGQTASEVRQSC